MTAAEPPRPDDQQPSRLRAIVGTRRRRGLVGLIGLLVLGLVLFLVLRGGGGGPSPIPRTPYLSVHGRDLVYEGQVVTLRGANFDNLAALGAEVGGRAGEDIGGDDIGLMTADEADYAELARQGGNHARLGLSFSWYQDDRDTFFATIDQQVAWARQHRLWVVLALFTTPGHCYEGWNDECTGMWTTADEQEQLRDFWVDVATHYRDEVAVAGYDLLNEPLPGADAQDFLTTPGSPKAIPYIGAWFAIAQQIRDDIAAVDPNHLVFIQHGRDGGFDRPTIFTGGNVVYETHYYDDGSHCEGDGTNAETRLQHQIGSFERGVPTYLGEWGVDRRCESSFLQNWATAINEAQISQAYYDWEHAGAGGDGPDDWGIYLPGQDTVGSPANPGALTEAGPAWSDSYQPDFSQAPGG
jgi:hypothetical protein